MASFEEELKGAKMSKNFCLFTFFIFFTQLLFFGLQLPLRRRRPPPPAALHAVPRIVHVSHRSVDALSNLQKQWLDGCVATNNDFEYIFWNDTATEALIEQHHPSLVQRWRAMQPRMKQIDLARYFFLWTFGGWYHDLDVECGAPLREMARHMTRRAVYLPGWTDPAMMASSPNETFWEHAVRRALEKPSDTDVWHTTGPAGLDAYAFEYVRNASKHAMQPFGSFGLKYYRRQDILREAPDVPVPADTSTIIWWPNERSDPTACNAALLRSCEPLCAAQYPDAWLVHHCMNSWRGTSLGDS